MPEGPTSTEQPPPKPDSKVARIPSRPDLRLSRDPALAHSRKEADKATVRRIVDNEANEVMPRIHAATEDAQQLKQLVAMASWSGSEREDALRLSLKKLEAAAAV